MRIIITDGHALNPGDLSWRMFDALGEVAYYDRMQPEAVRDRCAGADVIMTNRVGVHDRSVRDGEWQRSPDWCYTRTSIIELRDKVLGLIGFGNIGQQVARIAQVFGMQVLYYSRSARSTLARPVSMDTIFEESDFVSLHCPLTPENHSFLNRRLLSLMKPTAFLINTARGQLIHEGDLAVSLREGLIAGAALDVLAMEPPAADHPLIGLQNCLVTPHNAWMSREARQRVMQMTVENVRMALAGKPQHVVNAIVPGSM